MASETAYPLCWPLSRSRTKASLRQERAPFSVGENYTATERKWNGTQYEERNVAKSRIKQVGIPLAVERLEDQLTRLGATRAVLSTNLELRLNGMPRAASVTRLDDPGAAIYFTLFGKRTVLCCDKWTRVADNIAALAAHIKALRSIENYGVGTLEQAFRGYLALEDFSSGLIPWRRVLGFKDDDRPDRATIEAKYRELMKLYHTDITGGDHLQAAQLNLAIAQARAEIPDLKQVQVQQ